MSRLSALALVGVLSLGLGCSNSAQQAAPSSPRSNIDRSRCDRSGKSERTLDLNRDRRPDVWKLYAQVREGGQTLEALVCKEVDLNHDGRKDYWAYYDEKGNVTLEELDMDFDGRIDFIRIFKNNRIAREEMDTDHDGKIDLWKHYEGDALARLERDTLGRGRVDYWEYYEGGVLDRVGIDKNGDGQADVWERAPAPTPAAEEAAAKSKTPAPPKIGAEPGQK